MFVRKSESTKHSDQTVGGLGGHILRRVIHIAIVAVPLLYYAYAEPVARFFHLTPKLSLLVIFGVNIIVEAIRLMFGWTFVGHRRHEEKVISSFAWGIFSICLVLILAPDRSFAIPIIWSCAIGDPILGELRKTKLSRTWVAFIGVIVIAGIWWICTAWLGTPWRLGLLMGPLIVGLEWPNIKWIDDNALMQLIPLLIILLLYG
ncbi:hypothetical protein [Candidiatus Paracoxiella cheracis]|uniref:hypothetical protein n=1 Tax=Candidiatus Paracoxiella cheracis TaxID=3405120 RepID=UPI003BF4D3F9